MKKFELPKITNPKLVISIAATIIPFTVWVMATTSFVYVNYLGPFIFNLSQLTEIILFLFLPFTGLFTAIMTYKAKKTKLKLFLIIINILLLGIVVLGALSRVSLS